MGEVEGGSYRGQQPASRGMVLGLVEGLEVQHNRYGTEEVLVEGQTPAGEMEADRTGVYIRMILADGMEEGPEEECSCRFEAF